jgi:hypothetical protein
MERLEQDMASSEVNTTLNEDMRLAKLIGATTQKESPFRPGLFPIADGQGVIPSGVFMITAKEYARVIFPSLYQSSASSRYGPSPLRCSLITAPFTVRVCNRVNQ